MRPERARAFSRRGTRTLVELANDYAHTTRPLFRLRWERSATIIGRSRSGSLESASRLSVLASGKPRAWRIWWCATGVWQAGASSYPTRGSPLQRTAIAGLEACG